MKLKFRCDACGKYISLDDIATGLASRKLITPDSHLTSEKYETLCENCKVPPEAA